MRDNAVMKSGGRSYSIRIKETAAKGVTFGFRGGVRVRVHPFGHKQKRRSGNKFSRFKGLAGRVGRSVWFGSIQQGRAASGSLFPFKCPAAAAHVFVSVQFFCHETAIAPSPPIEIPAVVRALFRHGGGGETRLRTAENGSRSNQEAVSLKKQKMERAMK